MKHTFLYLTIGVLLSGCKSGTTLVGNTTDKHGCQVTAGYTWSEINKDCIRLFESATNIGAIKEGNSLLNVYVVFSTDGSMAELFIPTANSNPILKLDGKEWKGNDYVLSKWNSTFKLTKNGKEINLQQ